MKPLKILKFKFFSLSGWLARVGCFLSAIEQTVPGAGGYLEIKVSYRQPPSPAYIRPSSSLYPSSFQPLSFLLPSSTPPSILYLTSFQLLPFILPASTAPSILYPSSFQPRPLNQRNLVSVLQQCSIV